MKKIISITIGVLALTALVLAVSPTIRDEIHWYWAAQKDIAPSYEEYAKMWPNGRHATEAEGNIEALCWQNATAANTIESYREYIKTNPHGKNIQKAHTKIVKLSKDEEPFKAAMKTGTEVSLGRFIQHYPGHQKEAVAQQAIREITEGRDIVDLLKEKKIEIATQGSGIKSVSLRMRKQVPYAITVRVPVGSYFVSSRQSAQNMVTTAEKKLHLADNAWQTVSVPAACANRPRNIPNASDTFTVQRSPSQTQLALLMPVLERARVTFAVHQAAVWIVTDNANYSDLGILVRRPQIGSFSRSRLINEYESARAMKICDEAGIDIVKKAIWHDRQRIFKGLDHIGLKKWIKKRDTTRLKNTTFSKWGLTFDHPNEWTECNSPMHVELLVGELLPRGVVHKKWFVLVNQYSETEAYLVILKYNAKRPISPSGFIENQEQLHDDSDYEVKLVPKVNQINKATIAHLPAIQEDIERKKGGKGRTFKIMDGQIVFQISLMVDDASLFSKYAEVLQQILTSSRVTQKK